MHAREQIRIAFSNMLEGLPTTGGRVYFNGAYPLQNDELPALVVETPRDTLDLAKSDIAGMDVHELTVTVTALVKGTVDIGQQLDNICQEVETKILTTPNLGIKVIDTVCTDTAISHARDMEQPIAQAALTFVSEYRINRTDPGTLID